MRYHNITKDDMINGDGIRVVLWVSGCAHGCPGCHNQVTWDAACGLAFDKAAREEVFQELRKDYVSGITLSGGDPLYEDNRDEIQQLCSEIREEFPSKTIWLYTGYRWEQIRHWPVISLVDVVVDGPYLEAVRDTQLLWRGSENQRVIDVPKTRALGQVVLRPEPDYDI